MYNKGQESNASYPFIGRVGRCRFMASDVAATVTRVVNITAVSAQSSMHACMSLVVMSTVCDDVE